MMKALILMVLLCHMNYCYPSPLHHYVYQRVVFDTQEPTTKTTTQMTPQPELLKYQKAFDQVINKIRKALNESHSVVDLDAILQDLETTRLVL